MNMLRVWGGGIYESEDFYDLCDELGLLVWQDFMFACSLYPADRDFLASVRAEAEYQVKRLRHRTCLALWCGNNEIEQLNEDLLKNSRQRKAYTALFHTLLPDVVQHEDGITAYWPSSPYRGDGDNSPEAGEQRGDTHFWGVWHNRAPVKDYEKWRFRFVSEFGMQSYSSPATQMTFCPPDDANVFGPILENHQKNIGGNQVILDYVSRRYRFPKSQDDLIYLSQLNQAYCMQTGVEHYRRQMPHCMGALYWQLNDCWPVASWSSIEHTGHWKALHHIARRFFAPVLVTAHLPGEETAGIGNTRRFEINEVHLYTVSDSPAARRAWLRWEILHLDGQKLVQQKKAVTIRYAQSVRQKTLSLGRLLKQHGRDQLVLRISLEVDGTIISEESVFFAPPRFLNLRRGKTAVALTMKTTTEAEVVITSSVFQHRFALEFTGLSPRFSDNFIELFPNEPKRLTITFPLPVTRARLESLLRFRSLVDTYEENC